MGENVSNDIADIKEKVKSFIIENFLFGSTEETFADNDSFLETGIIDSTGILELIEYIEANFSITVNDNELVPENLDSLDKVSNFIKKKLQS